MGRWGENSGGGSFHTYPLCFCGQTHGFTDYRVTIRHHGELKPFPCTFQSLSSLLLFLPHPVLFSPDLVASPLFHCSAALSEAEHVIEM